MTDSLTVNLFEEPIEEGEFRLKNKPGETFRKPLVDRGNQLFTRIDIVGITHGKFTEKGDLATLLTFEFQFIATGGRRFKRASTSFKFEDSEKQPTRDPIVHAISPNGKLAINKTKREQNVQYGANIGINAGIQPIDMEAGIRWDVEEVKAQEFYTALIGVKKTMRSTFTGDANVVVWTMEENEEKEDGIPTFMRAAVLLRRPENVPFTFIVEVRTDVDFIGAIKTLWGLERKDPIDPVQIDPKAGRLGVKTLDPRVYNLNEMVSLDLREAADVTFVTLPDGRC